MAQNTTVSSFAPFFTATVLFKNDKAPAGAYDCVACGTDIGDKNTPAAISYKNAYLGQWAHLPCLAHLKQPVSDDKKAKKAAQAVHRDAFQAQYKGKATTTTTVSSTPVRTTVTTFTAPPTPPTPQQQETTLRATIEAEYEARLVALVEIISQQDKTIATLESDNSKLADELSKIMISSVATPAPTTMGRCGAQKKDGTACRWDTRKTACMHHSKAA